jgi:hypothetical protein
LLCVEIANSDKYQEENAENPAHDETMFFFKDAQNIIYATTRKYFVKTMHKKGRDRIGPALKYLPAD